MSTKKTPSAVPTEKAVSLLEKLKGKKLSIVGVCIGVFILAAIGVHYGYIPEEFLNPDLIVKYVSGVFEQPVVVDSTNQVVDTLVNTSVDTTAL